MKVPLPTRRATIRLARALAPHCLAGDLVILKGDLGAGKTFFVRALCRALGVPSRVAITSPTFTLVHEIDARLPVHHVDAYRLANETELEALGLRDARANGALLLVEWGEPFVGVLGGDALVIHLALSAAGEGAAVREAHVSATGPRSRDLLAALARSIGAPERP